MVALTQFVGAKGAAFERVGLAFQALGYVAPQPDTASDGAYVLNIVSQYRASLTQAHVLAIIEYGLKRTLEDLRWDAAQRDTNAALTMADISPRSELDATLLSLRQRRERLDMTQAQIAAELGVTETSWRRWETGYSEVGNPTMLDLALQTLEREHGMGGE